MGPAGFIRLMVIGGGGLLCTGSQRDLLPLCENVQTESLQRGTVDQCAAK